MKVTVRVTVEMADPYRLPLDAERSENCMVAQAVRPLLVDGACVYVSPSRVFIARSEGGGVREVPLPKSVRERVLLYDEGENPGSFAFELDIPARFLRDPERK